VFALHKRRIDERAAFTSSCFKFVFFLTAVERSLEMHG
jgi:hypothetical protein